MQDFSDLSSENDDEFQGDDYQAIFKELKSQWLLTEIDHSVSKCASEAFWNLGLQYFHRLSEAHGNQRKKTPQFNSIRRKINMELVPKVDLQIGFKNRDTGEIQVVHDTVTPVKNFSPAKYEKVYEIASIKVFSP